MYAVKNTKTKKELKERVKNGEQIGVFQTALGDVPKDGRVAIEGPHYPKPHRWYASCTIRDGIIVDVK